MAFAGDLTAPGGTDVVEVDVVRRGVGRLGQGILHVVLDGLLRWAGGFELRSAVTWICLLC